MSDKNRLLIQGRLLRDKPNEAEMTYEQWFKLQDELIDEEEFQNEQLKIVGKLAQDLMARQFASQLKSI
ncbi:MAG: hypothetical protein ABI643_04185 [Candidatus Doudnabacteria bacterium]